MKQTKEQPKQKNSRIHSSLQSLPNVPRPEPVVDQDALPIEDQALYQKLCAMLQKPEADGYSFQVPMDYITLGTNNRGFIDENDTKFISLKESIRKDGVIHNPTIFLEDGKPMLKAGFRRFRACQLLGFSKIWITIKTRSDIDSDVIQIDENILRSNLDPITYCEAMRTIKAKENIANADALAARVGLKDRGLIGYYLKAAEWPEDIKDLFRAENLNRSHIFKIARLKESNDPDHLRKMVEHHAAIQKRAAMQPGENEEPVKRQGADIDPETKKRISALIKAREDVPEEARSRLRKMAVSYSGMTASEKEAFADIISKL